MPKTDPDIRLADYSTVADRIALFYAAFPAGRIVTQLVSRENGETIFKALVFRQSDDKHPAATGWAAEREGDGEVNTVACLENTETSAVGRALANLGFTASSKRPSREEMEKVERSRHLLKPASLSPSGSFESRQKDADAVHDLIDLLSTAETAGFSQRRSRLIRDHFRADGDRTPSQVQRFEGRIRSWLRRHEM